ncbi:MAG: AAA family ATPase, partial [Bryobacteraceae bacterium]
RENLLNIPNAKVAAEYREITSNLYIRLLQDLERHPEAGLILDLAGDTEGALKVLERARQAAPDLYVIASNYHADGETVIAAVRSGANDFLVQPLKRLEFRDAMARLERAPKRTVAGTSKLGRVYTFLGAKGGAGATTFAVNFAAVLAERGGSTVLLDLDWSANECAMQTGLTPQYTLLEVGENLGRMDQALFEGFVTRDPTGFLLVGPPDSLEHFGYFSEPMFRDFAGFLVEKYDSIVIDAGRNITHDLVLGALHASTAIFLVIQQDFPSLRNAQRYIGALMRHGFRQDQLRVVVNQYTKKPQPHQASLDQIQQTLNQPVFYGIPPSPAAPAAVNRGRPFVAGAGGEIDRVFRAFVDKAAGMTKEDRKTA